MKQISFLCVVMTVFYLMTVVRPGRVIDDFDMGNYFIP